MPKAQPDHYYGFGDNGNRCQRCGMLRRPLRHPDGRPKTAGGEWSADGGKTWTTKHTACPGRRTMADETTPKTLEVPNCEKLRAAHNDRTIVANFVEWLEKNRHVIAYEREDGDLVDSPKNFDRLWLEYIEVDPEKLDDERRAILDEQRKLNEVSLAGQEPPCADCD